MKLEALSVHVAPVLVVESLGLRSRLNHNGGLSSILGIADGRVGV